VAWKKCFRSAFDELNIIPMKVIVASGGRSRARSGPRAEASKGAASTERPTSTPPGAVGW
jgi:hypothetical protein